MVSKELWTHMSRTHALVTATWRDDSQAVEVYERPPSEPFRAEGKLRVGRGSGLTTQEFRHMLARLGQVQLKAEV